MMSISPLLPNTVRKMEQVVEPVADGRSQKIAGKVGNEYILLNTAEVFAFQAEGRVVWIITTNSKYQSTHTLSDLQVRLRNTSFCRIHRNAIVNMDHIRRMSALSSQRWLITLANKLEFVVSKRQANSARQLLSF